VVQKFRQKKTRLSKKVVNQDFCSGLTNVRKHAYKLDSKHGMLFVSKVRNNTQCCKKYFHVSHKCFEMKATKVKNVMLFCVVEAFCAEVLGLSLWIL